MEGSPHAFDARAAYLYSGGHGEGTRSAQPAPRAASCRCTGAAALAGAGRVAARREDSARPLAHYDDCVFGVPGILLQTVRKKYGAVILNRIGDYAGRPPIGGRCAPQELRPA